MIMNGTIINNSNIGENVATGKDSLQYTLQIFQIVISSLVCFLGLIGNGLVIWFCVLKMKKTVNVVWFLNLAIADFTFAMVLPFDITSVILDDHWPFGDFMCKFVWFLFYLNMATSVLQLMVISVDRCVIVLFPVWSRNHRTRGLAFIVVLIIWIISVALTLPSYILRGAVGSGPYISCTLHTRRTWVPKARFFLFFLVPLVVITSCYTIIVLRIKDKSIIKSTKSFKVIIAVVIVFFVSWFPYHFFVLYAIDRPNSKTSDFYRIGIEIAVALMLLNSCINPVLYVFIGRDFKQKICSSFQLMLEKVFTEDTEKTQCMNSETLRSVVHPLTLNSTSAV